MAASGEGKARMAEDRDNSGEFITKKADWLEHASGPMTISFIYVVVFPFAVGIASTLEDSYTRMILLAIFGAMTGVSLCFLALTHFVDPGKLTAKNSRQLSPPADVATISSQNFNNIRYRWCTTCRLWRPPRCSHCSYCGFCVRRYDHHCPAMGNCIGLGNHRWFVLFLTTSAGALTVALTIYIIRLREIGWPTNADAWHHWEAYVVMIAVFICGCPTIQLFGFGCVNGCSLLCDVTTKERNRGRDRNQIDFRMANPFEICLVGVHLRPMYVDICEGKPHIMRVRPKPRERPPRDSRTDSKGSAGSAHALANFVAGEADIEQGTHLLPTDENQPAVEGKIVSSNPTAVAPGAGIN
mmetsp:Transcript_14226/g.27082  ORF Transcript_14226/g.27082 Transcript_14226/m.27082 type:complete len:355 (-) Transcript_14226:213-1277(-)